MLLYSRNRKKSDCMFDNIILKKYVGNMLNIYFPFTKPDVHLSIMA